MIKSPCHTLAVAGVNLSIQVLWYYYYYQPYLSTVSVNKYKKQLVPILPVV